jgi:hypothetical protein
VAQPRQGLRAPPPGYPASCRGCRCARRTPVLSTYLPKALVTDLRCLAALSAREQRQGSAAAWRAFAYCPRDGRARSPRPCSPLPARQALLEAEAGWCASVLPAQADALLLALCQAVFEKVGHSVAQHSTAQQAPRLVQLAGHSHHCSPPSPSRCAPPQISKAARDRLAPLSSVPALAAFARDLVGFGRALVALLKGAEPARRRDILQMVGVAAAGLHQPLLP